VHDQISDPNVPIFGLKTRAAIDSKTVRSINRESEQLLILKLSEPETERTDAVCRQYVSPGDVRTGNAGSCLGRPDGRKFHTRFPGEAIFGEHLKAAGF
jgi:hypothetical protein